jgi:Rha family phage regulatory protein
MNALVSLTPAGARTNSRLVADTFDKQHKQVLHAIDVILERKPELTGHNFMPCESPVEMANGVKRDVRFFEMDRDGFCLVAMGFTGEKALEWKLAFIEAFNALEHHVVEGVPAEPTDDDDGLDFDALAERMRMVREARLLFGRNAAKRLWVDLRLPDVSPRSVPLTATGYVVEESVGDWMATCTTFVAGHKVEASALYRHYVWWCSSTDRKYLSQSGFGRQLTNAGIYGRHSGRVHRIGLKLND